MIRYMLIPIVLTILVMTSCKEDCVQPSNSEYLIFGHFYGECVGEECIEIFRLENTRLFEDTKDQYPNPTDFYDGNYVQLTQQQFEITRDLIDYFPSDLLEESNTVIGQPDAGDWGGIYVEYNFNGIRKFWLLDQAKNNVPVKYHDFIDKVNDKINLLQ